MLYYSYPQIVLQEVPNEISLALAISGCPLRCKGCHSAFAWKESFGKELTNDELHLLLSKHKHITTVLFYGGEWQLQRLLELIHIVKNASLKVALYTGLDLEEVPSILKESLNYLKVGCFIEKLGGLDSKHTNQKFYNLDTNEDLTYLFFKN